MSDERVSANRLLWNEMARLHETSYFAEGASWDDALAPFEIAELGAVAGQRICHLQCHIGGDSLSLARLGATVVGVDFSEDAIEIARRCATAADLDDRVTFVCASVDAARKRVLGEFDGVYTSWGVLCWLPDLNEWADTIWSLLRRSGWLYLAETHPYASAVRSPSSPYGGAIAMFDDGQGDYTDPDAVFEHNESWEWTHGLGEIVSAIAARGMRVEFVHEHAAARWHLNDTENLRQGPDGIWTHPESTLPLSFSLRAVKP